MKIKKLSFLVLFLSISSLFAAGSADAASRGKRPAEEQAGPAAKEDNKSRRMESTDCEFLTACEAGDLQTVISLLAKGIDPCLPHQTFTTGTTLTALGIACGFGQLSVMQALLDQGIDPCLPHQTFTTGTTLTALGVACGFGQLSVVQNLLKRGVPFKRVTSYNRNAYEMTLSREIKETIKKHAITGVTTSLISLERFKKNQRLHFLSCCCAFVFADEFSEWKYSKLEARIPLICPSCQKANPAKELNILEYPFDTVQEEDEEPQAGAAAVLQDIPDID